MPFYSTHRKPLRSMMVKLATCVLLALAVTAPIIVNAGAMLSFDVAFKPVKKSFAPNEPIRFTVSGANQPFFVYLFSIDRASGQVAMILPSPRQLNNIYGPQQTNRIPHRDVEFFSRHEGDEEVVLVATTNYPAIAPELLNIGAFTCIYYVEVCGDA